VLASPAVLLPHLERKSGACSWKLGPILAICYFFFAVTIGFKQKTEGRMEGTFTVLSAGMQSFSLAHDYQMVKLIP